MNDQRRSELLRELLKNSRLSDRRLAKRLETSQPTITRLRKRLEKERLIRTYTIVPDFLKMGYTILAFTFSKMKSYPTMDEVLKIMQEATDWVDKHPNVIFAADGQGLGGKDVIMISLHKSYQEYASFMRSYALDWGHIISMLENFIVSVGSEFTMKPLDLRYLAHDR